MYSTVPLFVFLHTTIVSLCYKIFFASWYGARRVRAADYLVLDRYSISSLAWFDRLNCLYCEYANGVTLMLQAELDQVQADVPRLRLLRSIALALWLVPQTLLLLVGLLITTIPTNIFMQLLGLHRASHRKIWTRLENEHYAAAYGSAARALLCFHKLTADILSYNLEQIESAWCPIRHLERQGYVLPRHHGRFFSRSSLPALLVTLKTKGTVSERKSKYLGTKYISGPDIRV